MELCAAPFDWLLLIFARRLSSTSPLSDWNPHYRLATSISIVYIPYVNFHTVLVLIPGLQSWKSTRCTGKWKCIQHINLSCIPYSVQDVPSVQSNLYEFPQKSINPNIQHLFSLESLYTCDRWEFFMSLQYVTFSNVSILYFFCI